MAVARARTGDKMGDGDELGAFGGDRGAENVGDADCSAAGAEGAR